MIKSKHALFYKFCITIILLSITGCRSSVTSTNTPATSEINPYSFNNYQPNKFENIIEAISRKAVIQDLKNNDLYLETDPDYQFLSIIHGRYGRDCQNIPEIRLKMIRAWMEGVFGIPPTNEVEEQYLYEKQCLFIENSTEYWLPVQNILMPYIQQELSPDDDVSLYILWLGASKIDNIIDYVFLINNVQE